MEHSADGGVVHVMLPSMQPRKGSAPAPPAQPSDPPACLGSTGMWALFGLGWVFAPCWWAGAVIGLTAGSDSQCLIRRRRSLRAGQLDAWRACVTMSLLSAAALILVTCLWYGRPGSPADGAWRCESHTQLTLLLELSLADQGSSTDMSLACHALHMQQ